MMDIELYEAIRKDYAPKLLKKAVIDATKPPEIVTWYDAKLDKVRWFKFCHRPPYFRYHEIIPWTIS